MSPSARPLRRSRRHKIIAGVCGGIADYFGLTPGLTRVLYVLASILSAAFPGILVYIIFWVMVPRSPSS